MLEDSGKPFETHLYLITPPSVEEIKNLLEMLALSPRELMRKKESEYQALDLDNPDKTKMELILAMHENPRLIERPIVVAGQNARIGRPPENVMDLLND